MTMNGSWGYRDDNKWKSTDLLIRNLVDIASKGGNYLLNVGPKADGTFPDESIVRLREIGQWMDVNHEAIYGTKASPFGMLPWGRCTQKQEKGNTYLYFTVFDWPDSGELKIPTLKNEIQSAYLLEGDEKLSISGGEDGLSIGVPAEAPDAFATVIKVVVKGKVEDQFEAKEEQ